MRNLCLLLLISTPLFATVPGGIASINLDTNGSSTPKVFYQGKPVLVVTKDMCCTAIVGIPLNATAGKHEVTIYSDGCKTTKHFIVNSKAYPSESITIKDQSKVTPAQQDYELIAAQQAEIIATFNNWREHIITTEKLLLPVIGRFSSPFGYTRIINNIRKNPHSGLDIAAPKGTPVKAAKDGVVSNTGNYFYNGNSIFIDHGQSFVTSYCHLDTISVEKGQTVTAGDIIGTVGNTGRATGPHLHWSVSLNGIRVDPELFING